MRKRRSEGSGLHKHWLPCIHPLGTLDTTIRKPSSKNWEREIPFRVGFLWFSCCLTPVASNSRVSIGWTQPIKNHKSLAFLFLLYFFFPPDHELLVTLVVVVTVVGITHNPFTQMYPMAIYSSPGKETLSFDHLPETSPSSHITFRKKNSFIALSRCKSAISPSHIFFNSSQRYKEVKFT